VNASPAVIHPSGALRRVGSPALRRTRHSGGDLHFDWPVEEAHQNDQPILIFHVDDPPNETAEAAIGHMAPLVNRMTSPDASPRTWAIIALDPQARYVGY
jgi:dihydropteroate synthase